MIIGGYTLVQTCKGDGRFEDDERMEFLQQAIDAVKKHYNEV